MTNTRDTMQRISTLRANAKLCRDTARRLMRQDVIGNHDEIERLLDLAENCAIEALRLDALIPAVFVG